MTKKCQVIFEWPLLPIINRFQFFKAVQNAEPNFIILSPCLVLRFNICQILKQSLISSELNSNGHFLLCNDCFPLIIHCGIWNCSLKGR